MSNNKVQMTQIKSEKENQDILVKVLEQTKIKLKGQNDQLKEQVETLTQ